MLFDAQSPLTEAVLKFIPENRVADVVLFDASNPHAAFSFNPFLKVSESFKSRAAAGIVESLNLLLAFSGRSGLNTYFAMLFGATGYRSFNTTNYRVLVRARIFVGLPLNRLKSSC